MPADILNTFHAASEPSLAAHTDAEVEEGPSATFKLTTEDRLLSAPKRLHAGVRRILSPYRPYIVAFQLALFGLYLAGLAASVYSKHSHPAAPTMALAGRELAALELSMAADLAASEQAG